MLLTALGADSLIELLSGVTLLWRLRAEVADRDITGVEVAEERAVLISAASCSCSAYVVLMSMLGCWLERERSWLGAGIAAAAVVVMPWLAARKRTVSRTIESAALRADIVESAICAYLAGVTLVGAAVKPPLNPFNLG